MTTHLFADESMAHAFILAAAVVEQCDLASPRSVMGDLRLPGRWTVHFSRDSNDHRRKVLRALTNAHVHAVVVDATRISGLGSAAADASVQDDHAFDAGPHLHKSGSPD